MIQHACILIYEGHIKDSCRTQINHISYVVRVKNSDFSNVYLGHLAAFTSCARAIGPLRLEKNMDLFRTSQKSGFEPFLPLFTDLISD
jgi:hypothetical protein